MASTSPAASGLDELWKAVGPLKSARHYARGDALFNPGQPGQGVYLIEKGEVRLTLPTEARTARTFQVAGPGAVLGLSETLTGHAHKLGAEAILPSEVSFVEGKAMVEFLRQHHEFCLQVVRLLSDDLHALYHRFQVLSADGKNRRKAFPVM